MRMLPCIILGMQAHSCFHKFHLAPNTMDPELQPYSHRGATLVYFFQVPLRSRQ